MYNFREAHENTSLASKIFLNIIIIFLMKRPPVFRQSHFDFWPLFKFWNLNTKHSSLVIYIEQYAIFIIRHNSRFWADRRNVSILQRCVFFFFCSVFTRFFFLYKSRAVCGTKLNVGSWYIQKVILRNISRLKYYMRKSNKKPRKKRENLLNNNSR